MNVSNEKNIKRVICKSALLQKTKRVSAGQTSEIELKETKETETCKDS